MPRTALAKAAHIALLVVSILGVLAGSARSQNLRRGGVTDPIVTFVEGDHSGSLVTTNIKAIFKPLVVSESIGVFDIPEKIKRFGARFQKSFLTDSEHFFEANFNFDMSARPDVYEIGRRIFRRWYLAREWVVLKSRTIGLPEIIGRCLSVVFYSDVHPRPLTDLIVHKLCSSRENISPQLALARFLSGFNGLAGEPRLLHGSEPKGECKYRDENRGKCGYRAVVRFRENSLTVDDDTGLVEESVLLLLAGLTFLLFCTIAIRWRESS